MYSGAGRAIAMDGTGRGRSKKEVGEMPGSVPAREKLPTLCTGMAERQQLGREGKGQTQRQARAGWVGGGVVGPAMAVACFALSLSRFRRARGPALPGGHTGPTTEMLLRVTVCLEDFDRIPFHRWLAGRAEEMTRLFSDPQILHDHASIVVRTARIIILVVLHCVLRCL